MNIKIEIEAPSLVEAINNLAAALAGQGFAGAQVHREPERQAQVFTPQTLADDIERSLAQAAPLQQAHQQYHAPQQQQAPVITGEQSLGAPQESLMERMAQGMTQHQAPQQQAPQQQAPQQQAPQQQAPQQQAPQQQAPQQQAPVSIDLAYTFTDIARAASQLMDMGKATLPQQILASFGAGALTELNPTLYGAMATKLREAGASI